MNDYNKGVLATVLMSLFIFMCVTIYNGARECIYEIKNTKLNTKNVVIISHVINENDCKYYSNKLHFDDNIKYSVINKDTKLYELRMGSYLNRVGIIHITTDEFINMSIESDRIEGSVIK